MRGFVEMEKIDVVGGGIAGLYAAYKLKRRGLDVCVYEKSRRLGGRIGTVRFAGRDVPTGAGIGRGKDVLLRALCDELGVPVKEFTTQFKYRLPRGMEDVDIMRTVRLLRAHAGDRETFRQLGTRVLGKSTYRAFVVKTGYSDYEDADARDTLYNYGFEDTVPGYTALSINWAGLIGRLGKALEGNVRLGSPKRDVGRAVTIVATDIDAARKVTGRSLRGVEGQPFVRLYFLCDKDLDCGYTVCGGRFQKILQIGPGTTEGQAPGPAPGSTDGPTSGTVYMLYCDNATARRVARSRDVRRYIERGVAEIFGARVTVAEYKMIYWERGTHYFTPLGEKYGMRKQHIAHLQRPKRGVFVVGEAVSAHQGWCEGALESVENILSEIT